MQARLKDQDVPTAVHYPLPLHRQPAVADGSVRLPHGEAAAAQVMSLPMHPYLAAQQRRAITDAVLSVLEGEAS